MVGEAFAHYKILRQLGEGGMGTVYLALDTRLGRQVALKLVRPEAFGDGDHQQRLAREAQAASSLNHPHIVTIHDIGEADGVAFIAMEYVEGRSLVELISGKPVPIREAIRYASQIADALSAAHAIGIIHRDLKPANIVVTPDGRAKVLDFGVAKVQPTATRNAAFDGTQATVSATAHGAVVGTIPYMSPEQAEGRPIDARSDIFAFGAVFYEMLSGRRAFDGATPLAVLGAVVSREPQALTNLVPHLPPELDRIVGLCLRKDPARRFQHIRDVRVALDEAIEEQPARRRGRWSWPGRLAAAAGLFAAVGAAWAAWQRTTVDRTAATRQQLVSTFDGSHSAASLSPDGSFMTFLQDADGASEVFVKSLARGEPIQITRGGSHAERPRWSPRNDQIVFARSRQGIWSVPPLGGEPRLIIENGYNPNFSRDGTQLVFERERQILIAAADGTGARRIDGVPVRTFADVAAQPALSPDGATVAFFLQEAGPNGDLWTIPTRGGEPKRLTSDIREGGDPVWTPDGRAIVFRSKRGGSETLWRISADGGTPEALTTGTGADREPDLTSDGRRLVFTNVRNEWNLTISSAKNPTRRTLLERRTGIWLPRMSPDAQSLAFFQDVGPDLQLFTAPTVGGPSRQVTFGAGEWNIHPSWSPDGKFLYYYRERPQPFGFRRISALGGDSAEIAAGWRWPTHINAAIDPSGSRVVYHRQVPGETERTLIRDIGTGRETIVSEPGPTHLHSMSWSTDGQSILGWRHGDHIVICPSAGGPCRDVVRGRSPVWSHDRARVYFRGLPARRGYAEVRSVRNDGTDERKEVDIGPMPDLSDSFDVTSGGEIVWVRFEQGRRELWMMDLVDR